MPFAEPISWTTAERVASRIAGGEPFSSSYLASSLESDFVELTAQAETLVEEHTGLVADGRARVRVTDRGGWVRANLASCSRMLRPLTDRLVSKGGAGLGRVARVATGAQLGIVLGWTSTRVLGQYDLLLLEDERPEDQDIVYYVGPNVLALEKRYAFPPREFRLWLALHECTHRAQFTGVPWLPEYFRTQVHTLLAGVNADGSSLSSALRSAAQEVKLGRSPLADGGLLALFASEEQQDSLKRIYGLMSLLEGHGEITMTRAGAGLLPSADRFHRVLAARRSNASGVAKLMQRLLGMEAKLRQYQEGEHFIEAVEKEGGSELLRKVWQRSENLPTYDEIRSPQDWVKRMGSALATLGPTR